METDTTPQPGVPILVEGYVVAHTADWLRDDGWDVLAVERTHAPGPDIVATKGGSRLVVEAKGAGSSLPGSKRYGKPFNKGQVTVSVANAVWTATKAVARGSLGAIAIPDNVAYRQEIGDAQATLGRVPIVVFWVDDDGAVRLDNEAILRDP